MTVPWYRSLSLPCLRLQWWRRRGCGWWCLGISGSPLLARAMTVAVAARMMLPWNCWQSLPCLRNDDNDVGNAEDGALASSSVLHLLMRQWQRWWQPRQQYLGIVSHSFLACLCNGAAVVVQMMVPWHHWRPLLTCTRMVVVAVQMTRPWHHHWRSVACLHNDDGGGSVDDGALASSAVYCLLTHWQQQWLSRWWCLRIVRGPSLACMMMTTTGAVRMMVPWHHWPSSTCSRNNNAGDGIVDDVALASLVIPPSLTCAMTAAAVQMAVPWHCWRSVAHSCNNNSDNNGNGVDNRALALLAFPVCLLDDSSGGSSGAANCALASSAVPHLLTQWQWRWQRCGWQCPGIFGRPLLACVMAAMAAVRMRVPWHRQPSLLACPTTTTVASYLSSRKCPHQNIFNSYIE